MTGHRGFAGGHVVEHFKQTTNWDVLTTEQDIAKGFTGSPVDAIVNLAARSDVTECNELPLQSVNNNISITLNLLQWAREQSSLTHFIQVSTNEIYGPSPGGEEPREWAPIAPSTPYSASKVAQEALACAWWRTYGVPVVITNTMHLFGEHQPEQRFIPMAVRRLMAGEEVPIYARKITDLHYVPSTRRWLHASDHADALRWILERPVSTPENPRPDRWHIAGPEMNLYALVGKIAAMSRTTTRLRAIRAAMQMSS